MLHKIYTIGNYFIIESVSNLFPPIYSHSKNVVIYQKKRDVFAFSGLALNTNIYLVDLSNVGISEIVDVDNNAFIDSQAFINWYTANTGNFNRGVSAPTLKSVTSVNSILSDVNGNVVVPIPTLTSDLTNDSGFITIDDVPVPDLSELVPYTGATKDVDLGENSLKADSLEVSTNSTEPVEAGKIVWNSADGTFNMGLLNGVTLQAGQEMHMYVKASGVIANGDAVQFAGAQGDHLLIKKALPSEINTNPEYFVGVATQDFTNNQFGYVTVFGQVRGLDTDDYPEGTILYYQSGGSATGLLTDVRPTGPNAKITVAAVVRRHQNEGAIFVRPHVMPRISALQDVEIDNVTNNEVLSYNSSNEVWENKTIIEDAIIAGVTDVAPSQNAVFNAIETKQDNLGYTPANLAGDTFTGNIEAPSISLNDVNLESLMIAYAVALG